MRSFPIKYTLFVTSHCKDTIFSNENMAKTIFGTNTPPKAFYREERIHSCHAPEKNRLHTDYKDTMQKYPLRSQTHASPWRRRHPQHS